MTYKPSTWPPQPHRTIQERAMPEADSRQIECTECHATEVFHHFREQEAFQRAHEAQHGIGTVFKTPHGGFSPED
jgi:hypothetical protein